MRLLSKLRSSTLARNTVWMLLGYGVRLVLQSAAFVFLARILGVEDFGAFAAALAICSLIGLFVEMGSYNLAVRDVVNGVFVGRVVGTSLLAIVVSLALGGGLLVVAKLLLLEKIGWAVLLPLAFGVLMGGGVYRTVQGVNIGKKQVWRNSLLELSNGLLQLLWVAALYFSGGKLTQWALIYMFHNILLAVLGVLSLDPAERRLELSLEGVRDRFRSGFSFAVWNAAQAGGAELDKAILARLSALSDVGIYAAAQRVVVAANFPLMAFLGAAYPQFFEAGKGGLRATRAYATRIVVIALGYSLLLVGLLALLSPWLPVLLGQDFTKSQSALLWLLPAFFLQSLQFPLGDALSGAGLQKVRSAVQVSGLVLSVVLNLRLIPAYGWQGAAITALVTNLGMLIVFLALVYVVRWSNPASEVVKNG